MSVTYTTRDFTYKQTYTVFLCFSHFQLSFFPFYLFSSFLLSSFQLQTSPCTETYLIQTVQLYHWLRPSQRTMLTSCCRHLCGLLLRLYPCISTRVFNHVCTVYCTETYEDIRGKQPLATTSQQGDQSHWGYLQLTNIIIFLFITRQKVRCLYC